MKKVLVIAASLKIGGAEKIARDIACYSDPESFLYHYVVFGDEIGAYEADIEKARGKVFHLPPPSKNYLSYMRTLHRLIRTHHYHIIHAHTMFNCGWAMLVARWNGVPVRISHAHSALNNGDGFVKRIYEWLMRKLILHGSTDLVACGVQAGIRLFGKKAYEERGQLILNGIDTDRFCFDEEARTRIRGQLGWQEHFVIGHVGHLTEVKNQSFLLDMMPALRKQRPDARLLLLGEGEDRTMLEKKVRQLGLEDQVRLPGNVTNVADYLSGMDVFVFPSLYEGTPLSILEVQANGLPCVLSTGVPRDVYLTDLLQPLSLTDEKERWIQAILAARREDPGQYSTLLRESDYAVAAAVGKVYAIYNKEEK